MRIREGRCEDKAAIAEAIMMALGEEICSGFARDSEGLEKVRELFEICAGSEDSQYSWRNTIVAEDDKGHTAGLIVCYDGAELDLLRKRFLDEFAKMHGYRIDSLMTDETDASEFYIDSLAVWPQYRGQGIAGLLIEAAANRGEGRFRKPVGLLVEKTNHRARGLYRKIGFKPAGEKKFAGELMDHLVLSRGV